MEQSYKYQTPELLRLIDKQRYQDEEILKIYDFVEEISQEDGVPKTSRANKADGHVYNHIASKLEIIRSRMHRYRAKNEKLQFDVERITDELKNSHRLIEELSVKLEEKNNSRFESEKDAMIAELTQRLQNKEKTVSQLENQVQILKLGSDRNHSSRQSFTTDGSLTARQPGTFDSDNEGMGTRRPLVDSNINNVRAYEHFNYNDVLKDLREITSRASKALDQRNSIRSSHNANKTNQPHSASPFVKKDTPVKVQPRRMRDETIKKPSFPKYQEYEELKRKYGGFSNMSPIHR